MQNRLVYTVGIVAVVTVFAVIGFGAYHQSSSGSAWGPAQTAQVTYISDGSGKTVYTVAEPSGAVTLIEVVGTCGNLTIGSAITYRASSGINPATGTQSIQILNPLGCVAVSFGS